MRSNVHTTDLVVAYGVVPVKEIDTALKSTHEALYCELLCANGQKAGTC